LSQVDYVDAFLTNILPMLRSPPLHHLELLQTPSEMVGDNEGIVLAMDLALHVQVPLEIVYLVPLLLGLALLVQLVGLSDAANGLRDIDSELVTLSLAEVPLVDIDPIVLESDQSHEVGELRIL